MPSQTPHTTVRFDPEIRESLREYCRRTRLSLNAAVNLLVGEALHDDHTRREQRKAGDSARHPAGDPKVCGSCERGYYGSACPTCAE